MHPTSLKTFHGGKEIVEAQAGWPTRVERSLQVCTREFQHPLVAAELRASDLEGRRVWIDWNDETGAFYCVFADGDAAGQPIQGCVEDMDLRVFLPADGVEQGERWELPRAAMLALLLPGGEMGLNVPPGSDWVVERLPGHLWVDRVEGGMTATYAGRVQQDGVCIGRIEIVGEIETSAERHAGPDKQGLWTAMEYRVKTHYELRGEFLWDLDAGCMRSLRLTGPCAVEKSLTTAFDWMGMANVTREDLDLEGTSTFTAELIRE
jgi:hypothetical protein